ncbi:MAG: carboxypeptidase regulatory-like domain-containing protein [Acidobacteria bacterium]|nr:carboxypeptidase regulatory-like domain-containing protein [Acidobacteriota bacterium]
MLVGARIKLTGVVSRQATANDSGFVSFEALPAGRYDVFASAKDLSPASPHVFDLPGSGETTIALTLKPNAPTARATLACGGLDSRSIKALGAGAVLVIHVKVIGQTTSEGLSFANDSSMDLTTLNRVQVLQSFKSSAASPPPGSLMTVHQGGGRIDRGEFIDHHSFIGLGP